jgi:hypothetical protein
MRIGEDIGNLLEMLLVGDCPRSMLPFRNALPIRWFGLMQVGGLRGSK